MASKSTKLEPVLQTISHEYYNNNHKINSSFVMLGFRPLWYKKNVMVITLISEERRL